jgi:exopolysaccharide biosynthesis polyprenyl glycosylphosphotransferase
MIRHTDTTLEREEPRLIIRQDVSNNIYGSTSLRRTLIIGSGAVGQRLAQSLHMRGDHAIIGFVDDACLTDDTMPWPLLGSREAVPALIQKHAIDEVFVVYAPTWQQRLTETLTAEHSQVQVHVVPSDYETLMRMGRVQNIDEIAVVSLTEPQGRLWDFIKRCLDICVALLVLTATLPLMLIAALLIKLTSPGPAIFAQVRVGRKGRLFTMYKFRTMVQNAEVQTGPIKSPGASDMRVTPVGRWFRLCRIDELPQFWNVLRGEMSLVGPRPERPIFVEHYQQRNPLYAHRHEVCPGITGLAQVCGGYLTDPRDKLRFDLIYVSHRSLWMDLKILVQTVMVIFCSRGS